MKKHSLMMKISLLSISLFTTSAYSIASAIPLIQESFPEQSLTSIELLTMLPTVLIAVFVLLSLPIARKLTPKVTVLTGLVITLVAGIVPALSDNFTIILLSRALMGIGIGLFNSFAFSLINDFFEGDERASMLGYQSSFQGIGGALLTMLAGQLLRFGWHMAFWIYLSIIPVIFLFWFFVPNPPKPQGKTEKAHYVKGMGKYLFLLFVTMVLYNAIVIKLPNLFTTTGIGSAADSSLVFTIVQVASMVAGFAFGTLYKLLKRLTLPFAIAAMGIGFILIAFAQNMVMAVFGGILTGISFATYLPYLFNRAAAISPASSQALSSTLLIVFGQFAGFASSFLLAPLQDVPLLSNPFASCFLVCAIILIAEAVIVYVFQLKNSPTPSAHS